MYLKLLETEEEKTITWAVPGHNIEGLGLKFSLVQFSLI
jgi:hypothetical protein